MHQFYFLGASLFFGELKASLYSTQFLSKNLCIKVGERGATSQIVKLSNSRCKSKDFMVMDFLINMIHEIVSKISSVAPLSPIAIDFGCKCLCCFLLSNCWIVMNIIMSQHHSSVSLMTKK